ncbi:MAG: methionine--tRNA ligase [Candidatus Diapherotrites archaeon]|nr:methionine--tRNA ligase [Candidatus Diapherotrites archaeon]
MKFFITTAIDYPSSKPHLGHAYEKICADTIARWHRLLGHKVYFSTGLDEHGKKIERIAKKNDKPPQQFVEEMSVHFRSLCRVLSISFDDFVRTTEVRHEKAVLEIFQRIDEKGDVYNSLYEGSYCVECETYYSREELVENNCPVHEKPVELVKEDSYFFRMGKYQKQLIDFLEKNPSHLLPKERRNEILERLKVPLNDLSISRTTFGWGIRLPNNKKHIFYVWVDALTNYLTTVGFPKKRFEQWWPADMHLIGRDIVWHHTVIWWSLLMSAGLPLPKVFSHGFINLASGKMSKSKGNVVDPIALSEKYGSDVVRYFLLREIPFGEDGVFDEQKIIERNNFELANELGNLHYRVLSLIEKNCAGTIPSAATDNVLTKKLELEAFRSNMEKYQLHFALATVMAFVKECNKYVNEKEPWKLSGAAQEKVLYSLADSLRIIAILLSPFLPKTGEKISSSLGVKTASFKDVKFDLLPARTKVSKGEILFKKIEDRL